MAALASFVTDDPPREALTVQLNTLGPDAFAFEIGRGLPWSASFLGAGLRLRLLNGTFDYHVYLVFILLDNGKLWLFLHGRGQ